MARDANRWWWRLRIIYLVVSAGCVGVREHPSTIDSMTGAAGARAGSGPGTDASVGLSPDAFSAGLPDGPTEHVIGGPPLGDAACAAHTQQAERLPLDMYVMLDSSSSMTDPTQAGPSKWDAIRAALTSFLRDPASAGLGVGLQYFPLTKAGVPDGCASTAECGTSGPCNFVRGCVAGGTFCDTNADCDKGDTCELLGGCTLSQNLCLPVGGFCGSARGVPRGNQCVPLDGYCGARDICDGASYATPAVEVAPLPGAANGLVASLMQHAPDGLTPTAGALTGAVAHAQALAKASQDGRRVVVVLATDGLPSECAPTDIAGVAAIAASGVAGTPSTPTFVIGVFGTAPGEQQNAQVNLDTIAAAGGTKKAFVINVTQDVTQAFTAALNAVRTAALSCQFKVPAAAAGETVDFTRVNVQYTSGAGTTVTIGNVHDKGACDARQGGWYYDADPNAGGTPQNISVCDTTCAQLQGDAAGRVDVLLGCKTEYIIP